MSSTSFTAAGQRFTVAVPREPVEGAAAILPWVILAGGLIVVALGAALGLNAARRARAQEDLDRIFTLSQDLIAVADFNGRFTRVNPAAEEILGYTEAELLSRPYGDLVHPDDRGITAAETDALTQGRPTLSFQNRYIRKDGSIRVLDWTVTPDVKHGLMYAVARDVTERRAAEAEVNRLADEQAALRRVATLVASDVSQAELFNVIAEECAQLFGTEDVGMVRYEGGTHQLVMASSGAFKIAFPAGSRNPLGGDNAASLVFRTGRPVRIDDYSGKASGPIADAIRPVPASLRRGHADHGRGPSGRHDRRRRAREEPLPSETESRLGQFTELDGHRDRQHRVARPSRPADRGAGRAAPRGDARREGGTAGRGLRRGRRGAGERPRRHRLLAVPRRGRRNRARRRGRGRCVARGPSGNAAHGEWRRRDRVRPARRTATRRRHPDSLPTPAPPSAVRRRRRSGLGGDRRGPDTTPRRFRPRQRRASRSSPSSWPPPSPTPTPVPRWSDSRRSRPRSGGSPSASPKAPLRPPCSTPWPRRSRASSVPTGPPSAGTSPTTRSRSSRTAG